MEDVTVSSCCESATDIHTMIIDQSSWYCQCLSSLGAAISLLGTQEPTVLYAVTISPSKSLYTSTKFVENQVPDRISYLLTVGACAERLRYSFCVCVCYESIHC